MTPRSGGPIEALRQVPEYEKCEYRTRSADFCVCVFVINENGRLHEQLYRMAQYLEGLDLVVADGGSTDGSTERNQLESRGVNALLIKRGPGRLAAQMRMAFAWALGRGYRGVVTMDGNNKDGPEALQKFPEALAAGYDHIQGSRFIPGGISRNLPMTRLLGLKLVHVPLIRFAAGWPYTDTTNGFRAYSARFLADPRVAVFRDVFVGYELHYYLAIRAARLGFRVTEVPVSRIYPDSGPVPSKIAGVRGNFRVLKALVSACTGRYDP